MHSIHKNSTHPVGHSGMDSAITLRKVLSTNKLLICVLYIYLTAGAEVTCEDGNKYLGSINCLEILE
jgi:hypothetical protein